MNTPFRLVLKNNRTGVKNETVMDDFRLLDEAGGTSRFRLDIYGVTAAVRFDFLNRQCEKVRKNG